MGDISSGCTVTQCEPGYALKKLLIETAATADDGDTIVLTLSDYGIATFLGHETYIETTAGSVIVNEASTSAVTSGVLTLTLAGSTDDKKRNIFVYGK